MRWIEEKTTYVAKQSCSTHGCSSKVSGTEKSSGHHAITSLELALFYEGWKQDPKSGNSYCADCSIVMGLYGA